MRKKNHPGFSLVEALIAIGVFVIFAAGIYGSIQLLYRLMRQSRITTMETGLLEEQIELMHNLSFADIGTLQGSPAGVLSPVVTTTQGGNEFEITRTIRNVDDSFDGTFGNFDFSHRDSYPVDYRLAQIDIRCITCRQQTPLSLTTYIAPRYSEGNFYHGAVRIIVRDSQGQLVPEATVHVTATTSEGVINATDTTGADGAVRLYDLPTGFRLYNIQITKDGFTTTKTIPPSGQYPYPSQQPMSAIPQYVSEGTFFIDRPSSLLVSTENNQCAPVGNASLTLQGTKLINSYPKILKVNDTETTNGNGAYTWTNLEWDTYLLKANSASIIGTIPVVPISLPANTSQPISVIIGANSTHNLRVIVKDHATHQPLANATVRLTRTGYDETDITGVGTIAQTDWSGGQGQMLYTNQTQYATDNGNVDVAGNPGVITLRLGGQDYQAPGALESSIIDLGTDANPVSIISEPFSQPPLTGTGPVQFQIATSDSNSSETWNYLGPDGTAATYYTPTQTTIADIHDGDRYLRYKLFLSTESTTTTPSVSDVSITYTNGCTPPGQTFFGSLGQQTYTLTTSATGYTVASQSVSVNGQTVVTVELSHI